MADYLCKNCGPVEQLGNHNADDIRCCSGCGQGDLIPLVEAYKALKEENNAIRASFDRIFELSEEVASLEEENENLRHDLERERKRSFEIEEAIKMRWRAEIERNGFLVKALSEINAVIYPQLHKTADGKISRFTPGDPHIYLQALADKIREIPGTLKRVPPTSADTED